MTTVETAIKGHLRKMKTELAQPVQYHLPLDDVMLPLNGFLGENISLQFTGAIHCIACGRKTKKSFSQGYCFPCVRSLAQCDMCIMKPEQCHYDAGTCREPEWGETHCMRPHTVYLANSSGLKVGITRSLPTRWMDQGAAQALPIFTVQSRLQSGLLEVVLKQYVADKTNWRQLLKGNAEPLDLVQARDDLLQQAAAEIEALMAKLPTGSIEALKQEKVQQIDYPILQYPVKISSFNFDKTPTVSGVLQGIKGQYLILDTGVLNIRKFAGYEVIFSAQ